MGRFDVADAISLEGLAQLEQDGRDDRLLPVDAMTTDLARLDLVQEAAWQLTHGQAVWSAGLRVGEMLRAYGPDGGFLGVVQVDIEGRAAPRRLVAT